MKIKRIRQQGFQFPLFRTLQLIYYSSKKWAIALGGLLILRGVLPVISIYLTQKLIDGIIKGENWRFILILINVTGIVILITQVSQSLEKWVSELQSQMVSDYTYSLIHQKSVTVDMEDYENPEYYNKFQRAVQEASYRPAKVVKELELLVQNIVTLLAFAGILLGLHGGVILILMIAIIPNSWLGLSISRQLHHWQDQNIRKERSANYYHWILTHDWLAKEIRLFDLGSLFINRFQNLRRQLHREKTQIIRRYVFWELLTQIGSVAAVFGAYGLIVYQTQQGKISVGSLVMYYQALGGLQTAFQKVLATLTELYNDNLFLANLYEFLDLKPKRVNPLIPKAFPDTIRQGIVFEKVGYQYPNSKRSALRNINLTILPGEVIALVGENGSGKTTFTKLLSRLYDPTEGRITVDGTDLRDFDINTLRRQISVIFQDYGKYDLPVRENIGLGNFSQGMELSDIVNTACQAGADSFINRLPQQYETLLGKLFEGGEELSIGQWQKIALARALLRNFQLIILDEPTSALDPKAEFAFFDRLRHLLKNQIAILISHRLSNVRMADCIYVFEQGEIIETGNHEQLMKQKGMYANLFEIQSRSYS